MAYDKRLSKTMRIDLTEGAEVPEGSQGPMSSLTRMDWQPRRKAPEYVARSRYQELLQSLYDAALVTKLTGEIIDVNSRAVEFLRYDRADLFVMTIYEIISGADASLMEQLKASLEDEQFSLIQAYCMRSDGSYFPAEIAVSRLRLDEVSLAFFIRDISWRIEAEDRLRLEHQALQISGTGIVITDMNARLEYANPAFAGMLGYDDPDALLDVSVHDFFTQKDEGEELIQQVISDESTWMREMSMNRCDGSQMYAQVSATCNRSDDGDPTGIVFSLADITQHRQAEEAMQTAQEELQHQVDEQAAEMATLREAAGSSPETLLVD